MAAHGTTQQSIVKIVEGHVEQLIADHKRLSERNRDLTTQCEKLQISKRELQERVVALEHALSTAQLAATLTSGAAAATGDPKGQQRARAYVNRLLREIDTCLTYMTSPEGSEPSE